jgi:FKBP-type peptidyl-prolyl cis-trans isomerase SlyD
MKIAAGASVKIEYELKVKGGAVIESSAKSGPLLYVHGQGKMLPGLERRLEGLQAGDERRGEIPAAEAFGTEQSQPTKEMPRREFPKDVKLEKGRVFEARGPGGEAIQLKVIETGAETVKVRLVHPLAGRDLEYRVKVLAVIDARKPSSLPPPPGVEELDLDEIQES